MCQIFMIIQILSKIKPIYFIIHWKECFLFYNMHLQIKNIFAILDYIIAEKNVTFVYKSISIKSDAVQMF